MTETIAGDGQARKSQSAFRLEYTVGVHINASTERVWALMTDAADFPRWNSDREEHLR